MKSGDLNFLEPSGPLQACNGTALPLPLPVPTERATIILIKVKSCNALLHVLLACIGSCLKSALRYKFLILGIDHPETLYLDVRIRGYFSKPKEVREQTTFGNPDLNDLCVISGFHREVDEICALVEY